MAKKEDQNTLVALDIGTSKVAVLVAKVNTNSKNLKNNSGLQIIGWGLHPSHGLKRGMVVNIELTVQSIKSALEEAEQMAGCEIRAAFTGIAGGHIHSINSHGVVGIRDQEVRAQDVDRVLESAKAVVIPSDQYILHTLPQEFIVDHQEGVRDPIGMSGVRLEARVHIVTGLMGAIQNITKCVNRCQIAIADLVVEQLASSYAVLNDEEKEVGVCLIDIGGGTSDVAIFENGFIAYTGVVSVAGDHVTQDLASTLRISLHTAEHIKIHMGHILDREDPDAGAVLDIPNGSHHSASISRRMLSNIISARYEELFELIQERIEQSGLQNALSAGVVITGGASQMPGLLACAEKIFKTPCRLGKPLALMGAEGPCDSPSFSTGVGLLLYAQQHQGLISYSSNLSERNTVGLWSRMRRWFQNNF